MAGRGFAPKEHRTNPAKDPVLEPIEITDEVHGSPLPANLLPEGESWHPQTVAWWEAMRRWPLLKTQPDLSWNYLVDTAYMHHRMWVDGNMKLAAEVRIRQAKFGVTPEDQMRLKIKVTTPAAPTEQGGAAPGVPNLADRRGRLGA